MGEGLTGGGREEVLLRAVCPSALVRQGGKHMCWPHVCWLLQGSTAFDAF